MCDEHARGGRRDVPLFAPTTASALLAGANLHLAQNTGRRLREGGNGSDPLYLCFAIPKRSWAQLLMNVAASAAAFSSITPPSGATPAFCSNGTAAAV